MSHFAKLYTKGDDQVLVVLDQDIDEEKPIVAFYATPPGLGVCTIKMYYDNSEDGDIKARKFFDSVTEEKAWKVRDQILKAAGK